MTTQTTELNKLSEEQIEVELKTLREKKDKAPEEVEKLEALKEERQSRFDKRINKMTWEKKTAEEKAEKLAKELEEERRLRKELETAKPKEISHESVVYNGKSYYTDRTLRTMVDAGELTAEEAFEHQQERIEAKLEEKLEKKYQQNGARSEEERIRKEDIDAVKRLYPQCDPTSTSFDPEDPLYKLADELYREGYHSNPRGLTKAIERAKAMLGHTDKRPDLSDEFSVGRSKSGSERGPINNQSSLTEQEKEMAIRLYVYGNVTNPKTGKTYTEAEAIQKYITLKTKNVRK